VVLRIDDATARRQKQLRVIQFVPPAARCRPWWWYCARYCVCSSMQAEDVRYLTLDGLFVKLKETLIHRCNRSLMIKLCFRKVWPLKSNTARL
jgi:hypothetical protein